MFHNLCKIFCLALGVSFSCVASAQAAIVQEVKAGGVSAWLLEDHTVPTVAVKIVFKNAGSATDKKDKEGLASLTSELLLEGAGSMKALAFTKALEDKAIRLDSAVDEDTLSLTLETLSSYKDTAFEMLFLALRQPRFDEDAIVRAKARRVSALAQAEQNPNYLADITFAKTAVASHAYASPALGSANAITHFARKDFQNFAAQKLTQENMYISISGDSTPAEVEALLTRYVGKLPEKSMDDARIPEVIFSSAATVHVEKSLPQTVIKFGLQGLKRDNPDYLAFHALNEIVGGNGHPSRLSQAIRGSRGLTYHVSSWNEPKLHGALWQGTFATRKEQADEAVLAFKQTLADIHNRGVSAKELIAVKNYLTGSYAVQLDSNTKLAAYLANLQLYQLGVDYMQKRNALIEAITLEDVNRMAKLLDPKRLIVIQIGEKDQGTP